MYSHFRLEPRVAYPAILVIGVLLFIIGLFNLVSHIVFIKNGTIATAIIKEQEEKSSDGGVSYRAVFSFITQQHDTIHYNSRSSNGHKNWHDGDSVRVVYDERFPYDAEPLTYGNTFLFCTYLLAIGAGAIVTGGGYYLAQKFFKKLGET